MAGRNLQWSFGVRGVAVLLSEGREELHFSMKDVEDHGTPTSLATAFNLINIIEIVVFLILSNYNMIIILLLL